MAELSWFFMIDKRRKLTSIKLQQYEGTEFELQSNPASFLHMLLHPSSFNEFPSSHSASIVKPSPQNYSQACVNGFIQNPVLQMHWLLLTTKFNVGKHISQ